MQQRRYVPRVQLPNPSEMSQHEQRYLPEVQDILAEAGYRTVFGPAEYQLGFIIDDGPVNADTELTFHRGELQVAHAKARVGGPRIIFSRGKVIHESFQKCLTEFESRLPRPDGGTLVPANGGSSWPKDSDDYSQDGYNNSGYSANSYEAPSGQANGPDWQTGW